MSEENTQNQEVATEQLQADLDNAMNGWKRALADFENYKKQKERENKELVEFAREVAVAKLLPTLDALSQALKHLPEYAAPSPSAMAGEATGDSFGKAYQNWQVGMRGILMQLDQVLAELGVQRIQALGKKFDPHRHEAVREAESHEAEGTVVEELQSGFELNGKVIRPSQVVVSRNVSKPQSEQSFL